MNFRAPFRSWLRAVSRPAALDAAMEDELAFHRDRYAEDLERQGVPADEARRRAQAEFGSIAATKEECRDALGLRLLDELRGDLRYAARLLRRSPAFTCIAVLSLGLGVGANTAVFTLLDTVLLKPLPVEEPSRLFFVDNTGGKSGGGSAPPYPCYEILRDHNRFFYGMAAFDGGGPLSVTIDGVPERVRAQNASGSYYDVLGVRAIYGRVFTGADDLPPGAGGPDTPAAVISETYWERRFGRSPSVLGKVIQAGRTWVTIVGVTPREFRGLYPGSPVDLTLPMALSGNALTAKQTWWFSVVGRLKDSASVEEARADLDAMFQRYMAEIGLQGDMRRHFDRIALVPAGRGLNDLRRDFAMPLWIVMATVGLVLLIGCANLANLLIARAAARRTEFSIRLAIGASRRRLVRQLLTEGALLAFMGAATGLLLARWGVGTLVRFLAGGQQWILLEPQFDGRVLAFTTALAVFTGLLFSVVPALQTTRVDAAKPDDVGRASTGRTRARVAQMLIVVQVTLSLVLLSGAALFIRTVRNLSTIDAGFSRHGVLTMNVEATLPPEDGSPNPVAEHARVASIWGDFLDRIRAMPGVSSAALSTMSPLSRRDRGVRIAVAGEPPKAERDMGIHLNHVSAGYFGTFGIRLVQGRTFGAQDTPASPRVAILNTSAARMYFGQASPIGRMVSFPYQRIPDAYQIVGIVEDTRYDDLRKDPERMAYLPLSQAIDRVGHVIVGVRVAVAPSGVLREVREAARRSVPGSFVGNVVTIDQQIADSMLQERLVAMLGSAFGALALVLACIGVYGVLSFAVVGRTREIGIRLAVGAGRASVIWLVIREMTLLIAIALAAGIPIVLIAARFVKAQLFGVAPNDLVALSAAVAILVGVAAIAAFIPARRASHVDPMIALRYE